MSEGTGKGRNPLPDGGMTDCVATVVVVEDVTLSDDAESLGLYVEPEAFCAMTKGSKATQPKKRILTMSEGE